MGSGGVKGGAGVESGNGNNYVMRKKYLKIPNKKGKNNKTNEFNIVFVRGMNIICTVYYNYIILPCFWDDDIFNNM